MTVPAERPAPGGRRRLWRALGWLALLLATLWCALAIRYAGPGTEAMRIGFALAFPAGILLPRLLLPRPAALAVPAALFFGVGLWWGGMEPSDTRDWEPEYARRVSGSLAGDQLTLHDVRNFRWTSETEAEPRWEERSIDIASVTSVDLVASYWAGDAIAHIFLTFGFGDGQHLAISVETRRERGEPYGVLAGFFRRYELIFVVADERDLIGVRTDMRRERVHLYRLQLPPEQRRALFLAYLRRILALSQQPEFYNTLTNNCTTNVVAAGNAAAPGIAPRIARDWRILASGHLPELAYRLGLLDTSLPFEELRPRSLVRRAPDATIGPDFSRTIREGLPGMGPAAGP
ncbi:DUF4105 domain-containing protein [Roseomonas sp. OT10]|uniref:Lnb N-terminal periplasmic domain-containing protein n=1 Tax=Roseomonas cutis TaxID=2897332 RepID=UPI001E372095|nr:DUF4105 domain-containing protein [Roseomonas sp. OT10]UFN49530.1 DUF4105 domain-containing protein [Roseomonas sp. OT10]